MVQFGSDSLTENGMRLSQINFEMAFFVCLQKNRQALTSLSQNLPVLLMT